MEVYNECTVLETCSSNTGLRSFKSWLPDTAKEVRSPIDRTNGFG